MSEKSTQNEPVPYKGIKKNKNANSSLIPPRPQEVIFFEKLNKRSCVEMCIR